MFFICAAKVGEVQGKELDWKEVWHHHLEQKNTTTIGLTDHNASLLR